MKTEQTTVGAQGDNFEEWFLASVSADPMPVDSMLQSLAERRIDTSPSQLDSWGELMEEALTEQGRGDDVLRVLRLRAAFHIGDAAF
jgi:hypothetical protein